MEELHLETPLSNIRVSRRQFPMELPKIFDVVLTLEERERTVFPASHWCGMFKYALLYGAL